MSQYKASYGRYVDRDGIQREGYRIVDVITGEPVRAETGVAILGAGTSQTNALVFENGNRANEVVGAWNAGARVDTQTVWNYCSAGGWWRGRKGAECTCNSCSVG